MAPEPIIRKPKPGRAHKASAREASAPVAVKALAEVAIDPDRLDQLCGAVYRRALDPGDVARLVNDKGEDGAETIFRDRGRAYARMIRLVIGGINDIGFDTTREAS